MQNILHIQLTMKDYSRFLTPRFLYLHTSHKVRIRKYIYNKIKTNVREKKIKGLMHSKMCNLGFA